MVTLPGGACRAGSGRSIPPLALPRRETEGTDGEERLGKRSGLPHSSPTHPLAGGGLTQGQNEAKKKRKRMIFRVCVSEDLPDDDVEEQGREAGRSSSCRGVLSVGVRVNGYIRGKI